MQTNIFIDIHTAGRTDRHTDSQPSTRERQMKFVSWGAHYNDNSQVIERWQQGQPAFRLDVVDINTVAMAKMLSIES